MAFDGLARAFLEGSVGYLTGRRERKEQEQERADKLAADQIAQAARERQAQIDEVRRRVLEGQLADQQAARGQPAAGEIQTAADGTLWRIDPRTGQGTPIRGPDGQAIRGAQTQRNIDPLSREGVQAAIARARGTAAANAQYRVPTGGVGQVPGAIQGRTLPASVANDIIGNQSQLATIAAAEDAIDRHPSAVGVHRAGPDAIHNILDPDGVAARSAIANIGSLVIKNRSGAAVSVHEMARMRPFIPTTSDPPDIVRRKLAELKRLIAEETDALARYYQQQGYAVPGQGRPLPDFSGTSTGGSSSAADDFSDLELP